MSHLISEDHDLDAAIVAVLRQARLAQAADLALPAEVMQIDRPLASRANLMPTMRDLLEPLLHDEIAEKSSADNSQRGYVRRDATRCKHCGLSLRLL